MTQATLLKLATGSILKNKMRTLLTIAASRKGIRASLDIDS